MKEDCQEILNHVAGCENCISLILLNQEDILKLPQAVIDKITAESLKNKKLPWLKSPQKSAKAD